LKRATEVREVTSRFLMLESLVMISSVVPSLKYSFCGSPLRF
jgi:hypothetical protein